MNSRWGLPTYFEQGFKNDIRGSNPGAGLLGAQNNGGIYAAGSAGRQIAGKKANERKNDSDTYLPRRSWQLELRHGLPIEMVDCKDASKANHQASGDQPCALDKNQSHNCELLGADREANSDLPSSLNRKLHHYAVESDQGKR